MIRNNTTVTYSDAEHRVLASMLAAVKGRKRTRRVARVCITTVAGLVLITVWQLNQTQSSSVTYAATTPPPIEMILSGQTRIELISTTDAQVEYVSVEPIVVEMVDEEVFHQILSNRAYAIVNYRNNARPAFYLLDEGSMQGRFQSAPLNR